MTKFYSPAHTRRLTIPLRSWDDEEIRRFIEIETYLILQTLFEAYQGSYTSFQLLETFCEVSNCSKDLIKKHYEAGRKGYRRPTPRERVLYGLYKGWSLERIRRQFRMEYQRVSQQVIEFYDEGQPKTLLCLVSPDDALQLERFNQILSQFVRHFSQLLN